MPQMPHPSYIHHSYSLTTAHTSQPFKLASPYTITIPIVSCFFFDRVNKIVQTTVVQLVDAATAYLRPFPQSTQHEPTRAITSLRSTDKSIYKMEKIDEEERFGSAITNSITVPLPSIGSDHSSQLLFFCVTLSIQTQQQDGSNIHLTLSFILDRRYQRNDTHR